MTVVIVIAVVLTLAFLAAIWTGHPHQSRLLISGADLAPVVRVPVAAAVSDRAGMVSGCASEGSARTTRPQLNFPHAGPLLACDLGDGPRRRRDRGSIDSMADNKDHLLGALTQEWVYRHQHYLVTLFRFGLTAVFVTAIPWLSPEARAEVAPFEWIFPLALLVVVALSTWFISEEWVRARSTYSKIKELRGKDDPDYTRDRGGRKSPRIGGALILGYVVVLVALNLAALFALTA